MNCDDLVALGSEKAVKESGKMRSEGRDYVVQEGDVMLFRLVRGGGGGVVTMRSDKQYST